MSSSASSSTLDSKTSVSLTESSESLDVRLNQTDPQAEAPLIHHDPQAETVTVTASTSASTTSSSSSSSSSQTKSSEPGPDTLQDVIDLKSSLTDSLPDYQSQTENLAVSGTIISIMHLWFSPVVLPQ